MKTHKQAGMTGRQRRALEAIYVHELAGLTPSPRTLLAMQVTHDVESVHSTHNILRGIRDRGWATYDDGATSATLRLTRAGRAELWAHWAPLTLPKEATETLKVAAALLIKERIAELQEALTALGYR